VTDRFPDMAAMARGATEDYSRIDSPNWWALRKRLEELLARDQRRLGAKFTADARRRSELAKWTALGNEDAKERFEHGRGF
jgi:hypothetical protein